ncbi:MAG: glycosyltransferase family 4 protein [Bacteroidia bacterium]
MKKVLIVQNIPNPYRIPLFNELHTQLQQKGIDMKVVFGAATYKRRKFSLNLEDCHFDFEILKSSLVYSGKSEIPFFGYNGLLRTVIKEKPDLIIIIGFSLGTFKLWLRSFFSSIPFLIWSGSITTKGRKDSPNRRRFRKALAARAAGFVAYGTKAKEYLMELGVPAEKIHIGINTTDISYFRERVKKVGRKLSGSRKNLLTIGYLTRGKRIDLLLQAIKHLSRIRQDFVLKIVGAGAIEEELKQLAAELQVEPYVSFEGFQQKTEIPGYLAEASVFLFPSEYDIWGLVLVEALAAGVPAISSIHAGATMDLIVEGKTGFAMDFEDTEAVAKKIDWLLENPEEAARIGAAAQYHIETETSLAKSAAGFVQAIEENLN